MNKKFILFSIASILLVGGGYYFVYPIFRVVERNDPMPEGSTEVSPPALVATTSTPASQTSIPAIVSIPEYEIIDTPAHPASGKVKVLFSQRKTVIRFENLETIDGPDVHIYLSKDLEAKEYIDLGEMKATRGNINYEVPDEVNVKDYIYVLAWCEPFNVLFHYAKIR